MKSTRIVLLGVLTVGAMACANIWGFEDFQTKANDDASLGVPGGEDAAFDAGVPGDADATVSPVDSPTANEATDGRDATDAGDARDATDANDASDSSCPSGLTLCGTKCLDTTSDPNHCGGCQPCLADNMTCVASTCVCATNFHLCAGACSSNLSVFSCGTTSCTICPTPQNGSNTCTTAGCGVCSPTLTLCDRGTPAAACVDVTTDPAHCGACGTVCPVPDAGGVATCGGAIPVCGMTCNLGLTACPAVGPIGCFDLTSDVRHCGTCATVCPPHDSGPAAACVASTCH